MELVLQQLQSYQRLRMLVITAVRPNYVLDAAVAHHVSSCVAGPLESLELKGYVFRQQNLMPLLHAMQSCSTLVRLVLTGEFENEAASDMAAWLRQPRESSLRELCVGGGSVMASILTALEGSPQQSGAGAWLRVLEFDTPMYDIQDLMEALADKRSQLRTLSLSYLNDFSWRQLVQYLPDMTNMRNLNVTCCRTAVWPLFRQPCG
jgi:hypothetical protein